MANKVYLIDHCNGHCPVIRELIGVNTERTGWWIGSKG